MTAIVLVALFVAVLAAYGTGWIVADRRGQTNLKTLESTILYQNATITMLRHALAKTEGQ